MVLPIWSFLSLQKLLLSLKAYKFTILSKVWYVLSVATGDFATLHICSVFSQKQSSWQCASLHNSARYETIFFYLLMASRCPWILVLSDSENICLLTHSPFAFLYTFSNLHNLSPVPTYSNPAPRKTVKSNIFSLPPSLTWSGFTRLEAATLIDITKHNAHHIKWHRKRSWCCEILLTSI